MKFSSKSVLGLIFSSALVLANSAQATVIVDSFDQGDMHSWDYSGAYGYHNGDNTATYSGTGPIGDFRQTYSGVGHWLGGGRYEEVIVDSTSGTLTQRSSNGANGYSLLQYGQWAGGTAMGEDWSGFTGFSLDILSSTNAQIYAGIGTASGTSYWTGWMNIEDSLDPFTFTIGLPDFSTIVDDTLLASVDSLRFYLMSGGSGSIILDEVRASGVGSGNVPLPATVWLMFAGIAGLLFTHRKRNALTA